ncbi:MAG: response regulator transcription factor [Dehalococcoidia bacterium]|nr:response regulator transcription factor [Dehalococcoidia bacterium]
MVRASQVSLETGGPSDDTVRIGNLVLDTSRYSVIVDSKPVDLTYKEFELLKFLAVHVGQITDRVTLMREAWGEELGQEVRKVDVHIARLRKKLARLSPHRIVTVNKRGYGLATERPSDKNSRDD